MENRSSFLSSQFEEQVKKTPTAIACIDDQSEITYRELNEKANQLAEFLKEQGMMPGSFVGIWGKPSIQSIIALMGVIKAEGVYIGLSMEDPYNRQDKILNNLHPAFVLCTEQTKVVLPRSAGKLIFMADLTNTLKDYTKENPPVPKDEASLATIIYRSDPTGLPTGVMLSQQTIVNLIIGQDYIDEKRVQIIWHPHNLTKVGSILEIWGALLRGLTILITKEGKCPEEKHEKILCVLNEYEYHLYSKENPAFIQSCETILLRSKHYQIDTTILPKQLIYLYGPVECAGLACYTYPGNATKVVNHLQIKLLDQKLKPAKLGHFAEVVLSGTGLSNGYLHRNELTQSRFIEHNGERLYKTGDRARLTQSGQYEFQEKVDREIDIKGETIYPEEIEVAITEAPDIEKAYVLKDINDDGKEELNAYMIPNQNSIRINYDGPCVLEWEDGSTENVSVKDLSKAGIGVAGSGRIILLKENVSVSLPKLMEEEKVTAEVIWQIEDKLGIRFVEQNEKIDEYIDDFLKKQNNIIPQKRNIKKFLLKKLPSWMLPLRGIVLSKMPVIRHGEIDREKLKKVYDLIKKDPIESIEKDKNLDEDNSLMQLKRDMLSNSGLGKKIAAKLKQDYLITVSGRDLFSSSFYIDIALRVAIAMRDSENLRIPTVSRHQPISLSIQQLEKLNDRYHSAKIQFKNGLTEAMVRSMIDELLIRHEILRMKYIKSASGEWIQEIVKNVNYAIKAISQNEENDKVIEHDSLFKIFLTEKEGQSELQIAFHESIADHRSLIIFSRDLMELYQSHIDNREPKLRPLLIQYLDYATWEKEQSNRAPIAESTFPQLMKNRDFKIDAGMTSALRGYSVNVEATLPIVLICAFSSLWAYLTQQDKLSIETSVLNRDREDIEDLIGPFEQKINFQVLFKEEDQAFKSLVEEVKKEYIQALQEKKDNKVKADIGFFFYQDELINITESSYSPYPLKLTVNLKNDHMQVRVSYLENGITEEMINKWEKAWILMLQMITSDPALSLNNLEF